MVSIVSHFLPVIRFRIYRLLCEPYVAFSVLCILLQLFDKYLYVCKYVCVYVGVYGGVYVCMYVCMCV